MKQCVGVLLVLLVGATMGTAWAAVRPQDPGLVSPIQAVTARLDRAGVLLLWSAGDETPVNSYVVLRAGLRPAEWTPVGAPIPALATEGMEGGGHYQVLDPTARPGSGYVYCVEAQLIRGGVNRSEPLAVTVPLSLSSLQAAPGAAVQARALPAEAPLRSPQAAVEKGNAWAARSEQAGERIKMLVKDTGMYFMPATNIAAKLGWTSAEAIAAISNRMLRLSCRGQRVAYLPETNPAGIYFFNRALCSLYTDWNVYWLESGNGWVLPAQTGSPPAAVAPAGQYFMQEQWVNQGAVNFSGGLPWNPESNYFHWAYRIAPAATNIPVILPGVTILASGSVTLQAMGGNTVTTHYARLKLNGAYLAGQAVMTGCVVVSQAFTNDSIAWNSGSSTVTVECATGSVYFMQLLVRYPRIFQAAGNALTFDAAGYTEISVAGYSNAAVRMADVTVPFQAQELCGLSLTTNVSGHVASFYPPATGRTYCAFTAAGATGVTNFWAVPRYALRSATNQYDYLILTVDFLTNAANRLLTHRKGQGWRARLVEMEEIYDEFDYGYSGPHATEKFLAYALQHWSGAPRYVLLAGDASYDFKNLRNGNRSLIPGQMYSSLLAVTASDTRMADVLNDDGRPDVAIGRLPVVTAAELSNMVDKIIAYESGAPVAGQDAALFTADFNDLNDFHASSDAAAAAMPAGRTVRKIYRVDAADDRRAEIAAAVTAGSAYVNYFGHGSIGFLGQTPAYIMDASAVSQMTNARLPAVFLGLTCDMNRFDPAASVNLGERLVLQAGGGAVASWAPVGLSYNDWAEALDLAFWRARFEQGHLILGDAIQAALQEYMASPQYNREEMQTFNLLGDPALRLK